MLFNTFRSKIILVFSSISIAYPVFAQTAINSLVVVEDAENIGVEVNRIQAIEAEDFWTNQRMSQIKGDPIDGVDDIIILSNSFKIKHNLHSKNLAFNKSKKPTKDFPITGNFIAKIDPVHEINQFSDKQYPVYYYSDYVGYDRYKEYPERTVGKIVYVDSNNKFRSCSGATVVSSNKNLVWTAAHCISDGKGNFHTNVVFIPAYKPREAEKEPFGRWSACGLYVKKAWHNQPLVRHTFTPKRLDWAKDYGAIKVCEKDQGAIKYTNIHDAIGWLGWTINQPRYNERWAIFGYPQDPPKDPEMKPFDGTRMFFCDSYSIEGDGMDYKAVVPSLIGIGCDMTAGSSGSPWITNYADYVGNQLASPDAIAFIYGNEKTNMLSGVTSWRPLEQPEAVYSPYLDNSAENLRLFAIQQGS